MTIREVWNWSTLSSAGCYSDKKCESERELEQTEFSVSFVQGIVAQTKEKIQDRDWTRTSLLSSKKERVDKVGQVELSDVRASDSNLTGLQPL